MLKATESVDEVSKILTPVVEAVMAGLQRKSLTSAERKRAEEIARDAARRAVNGVTSQEDISYFVFLAHHFIAKRIIGVALTGAAPGDPFIIYIRPGRYC
jgi:hypothetical protein